MINPICGEPDCTLDHTNEFNLIKEIVAALYMPVDEMLGDKDFSADIKRQAMRSLIMTLTYNFMACFTNADGLNQFVKEFTALILNIQTNLITKPDSNLH